MCAMASPFLKQALISKNSLYDFINMTNHVLKSTMFLVGVDTIEKLMEWAMYSMSDYSSIFIDGLSNYPEGFYYTRLLIKALNENKPPNFLLDNKKFIEEHNFSLTTIRKQDKNNTGQGGMCWIKIAPNTLR